MGDLAILEILLTGEKHVLEGKLKALLRQRLSASPLIEFGAPRTPDSVDFRRFSDDDNAMMVGYRCYRDLDLLKVPWYFKYILRL